MASDSRKQSEDGRVVLDVEDAREIGPTEAAGLVNECLALTYRRLDAATWLALEELSTKAPIVPAAKITPAVLRERSKFFPHFKTEFNQLFQLRCAGKARERGQRGAAATTLALVEEGDLTGQVALKNAVAAMQTAVRDQGFDFDIRARIVMREPPSGEEFQNPWGPVLICDALGNTCRALWTPDGVWRPVMEYMVRALTPEVLALHRDLNALLQERDILPVMRVRTRKRTGESVATPRDEASLYDKLVELLEREAHPAAGAAAPPGAAPAPLHGAGGQAGDPQARYGQIGWPGAAGIQTSGASSRWPDPAAWPSLLQVLNALERAAFDAVESHAIPGLDAAAVREGTANQLPVLASAVAQSGSSPRDRVAIEIISAVLDEVFDSPYLPAEIKTIFGRLQIPMLKAALLDQQMLVQRRHPVRRFFDALAAASVGLLPGEGRSVLFIELASHLASMVRDRFADDLEVFDTVRGELEAFLDFERAAYNQKLAQALPVLLALDESSAARARVKSTLALRLAGKDLPSEIREFIDREGLTRLTSAYLKGGPEGAAWKRELQLVDDLVWSIAPKRGAEARRRLVALVPLLVRRVSDGWPLDEAAGERRKAFLARLYELHMEAIKVSPELQAGDGEAAEPVPAGLTAAERASLLDPALSVEDAEVVDALTRGDWCVFEGEPGAAPLLGKYAWCAPHGTQLLFTHRDGSIAIVHTPESLGKAFRARRAGVAVDAVPLFERAMERVLDRRVGTMRS